MHDPAVSVSTTRLEGRLFNVQRCTIHDGPGIRTTVFLKGCPLSCAWCHNPEGIRDDPVLMLHEERCIGCSSCIEVCPVAAGEDDPSVAGVRREACVHCGACVEACPAEARDLVGRNFGVGELMDLVERDRPFFEASGGGVTFSGGEPLRQPEFLTACLEAGRGRGLHTAVDTCGVAPGDVLLEIGATADLMLYDIKHMDPVAHRRLTGVDNRPILENLAKLSSAGAEIWIRVPIIAGVNDDPTTIDALGAFVGSLEQRHPVFLLPYHATAEAKASRAGQPVPRARFDSPKRKTLEAARERLEAYGLDVTFGGP